MERRYGIPKQYEIREFNNLKGILRKSRDGKEKWIWEPMYEHIIIGRAYGKIVIAYKRHLSGEEFLRLADYRGKLLLRAPIYDILFGDGCLYIKTIRQATGQIEWCLVDTSFEGGLFVGDFQIVDRSTRMPFHIQRGIASILVRLPDGNERELELCAGKITVPAVIRANTLKIKEEEITHYNVLVNSVENNIMLVRPYDGRLVKESTCIGEVGEYTGIIQDMLGGLEGVPKEKGDLLVSFLSRFEYLVNGIALPILHTFVSHRLTDKEKEKDGATLKAMIEQLDSGWTDLGDGFKVKLYTCQTLILALIKPEGRKITVAVHAIEREDDVLEPEGIAHLAEAYRETGNRTTALEIVKVGEKVYDDDDDQQLPYSVVQRKALVDTLRDYRYETVRVNYIDTKVVGSNGNKYGDIGLYIVICNNLAYLSRQQHDKGQEWVLTNICHAQIS